MPRYKLTLEYNGTPYSGWQKQQGIVSVQGELETAVFRFSGVQAEVVGAGRTDAGVHAIAQVAHVELPTGYDPFRVMQGINFHLFDKAAKEQTENHIAVIAAELAPEEFHARFSATKRHYAYRIINRRPRLALEAARAAHVIEPLDVDAMQQAARHLIGHHDFTSFRDTQCQAKSPLKTLDTLDVRRYGQEVRITASARSFLHHQMRIMTGTLELVGKGKWRPQDVKRALEAKNRTQSGPTAPPEGLYLTGVDYD